MSTPNTTDRAWLTPQEAAEIAEVSPSTIIAWCARYQIGRKVAGRRRIDPAALQRLLDGDGHLAAPIPNGEG